MTVLGDLAVDRTYTFALSAYTADGRESTRSNERSIGYADVAAFVDSDGDGLTDAEEDTNLNGIVDPGETDRLRADTDGDGIPDGIERARGTDPLDASTAVCAAVPFDEFGFGSGGVAEIAYDGDVGDTVLRATATTRSPLRFRASYPARGVADLPGAVLTTALSSAGPFEIEVTVRSTAGKRYLLRYDGNGGKDRVSGRRLTLAVGDRFAAGTALVLLARDLAADLTILNPDAVLAAVTRIRIRGGYTMSALRLCQ